MRLRTLVTGLCVVFTLQTAGAQSRSREPRRRVKPPIVDLEKQARDRRPGQVMPGDPMPNIVEPPPESSENVDLIPLEDVGIGLDPMAEDLPIVEPSVPPSEPVREPPRVRQPMPRNGVPGREVQENEYAQEVILGYGPVRAEVTRIDGPPDRVQWRAVSAYDGARGPWHTPRRGERLNGRVEVRSGLGTTVHIRVDDRAEVIVGRLSRVTLEQAIMPGAVSETSVELRRGRVGIHMLGMGSGPILFRTPDVATWVRADQSFDFDAFRGTTKAPLLDF